MKMRGMRGVCCYAAGALLAAGGTAQAQVWLRSADWVPGAVHGSSTNNPGPVGGVPTWQYEVAQGGGLGSANPWYEQPTQLMTWDSAWWQTGWSVWSKGDDFSPPVLPGRLIHNVHPTTFDDVPIVRWMNPMGNGLINISGTLTVNWNGVNGLGRPVDVDVVIARYDASSNTTMVLYSATVSKPNPFPSVGDSVLLPISLTNIPIDADDSIIFSHRGQTAVGPLGAWVNLYDAVQITPVPAPGAAGVLALGGLLAARRRRR